MRTAALIGFTLALVATTGGCARARIDTVEVINDSTGICVVTDDRKYVNTPHKCVVEATYGTWKARATPPIMKGVRLTRTWLASWTRVLGGQASAGETLVVRYLYNDRVVTQRAFPGIRLTPSAGKGGDSRQITVNVNQNQNTNQNLNNRNSANSTSGRYCSQCGASADSSARFCSKCGNSLR